tara:strand:- start:483 stop:626 length:144 start_codon:yes stop_codon:yes gene_type:complete
MQYALRIEALLELIFVFSTKIATAESLTFFNLKSFISKLFKLKKGTP